MIIGTIKEVKDKENRVGLLPDGVKKLVKAGNKVLVQKGAGVNSGFSDTEYRKAGAKVLNTPRDVVKKIDVLVKVKEPIPKEYPLLKLMKGKTLYTFLHLAAVANKILNIILLGQLISQLNDFLR